MFISTTGIGSCAFIVHYKNHLSDYSKLHKSQSTVYFGRQTSTDPGETNRLVCK